MRKLLAALALLLVFAMAAGFALHHAGVRGAPRVCAQNEDCFGDK